MVDLGALSDPPQMSTLLNPVQRALAARTRAELLDTRGPERPPLSLPAIQRLTAPLETPAEAVAPLRIDILHTYAGALLDPCIRFEALAQGLDPAICHWPLADHGLAPRPDGRHQRSLDGPIRRDADKVPVHAVDAGPAPPAC